MTVTEIVKNFLKENGFDGLVNINEDCGCVIDNLAPCLNDISQCDAGYKVPRDCGDYGYDFYISVSRPTPNARDANNALENLASQDSRGSSNSA